jgi:hypothetical protein
MSDELCPVCHKTYTKKREFETTIVYHHIPPTPNCEQRVGLPINLNKAESTPPSVLRRKRR